MLLISGAAAGLQASGGVDLRPYVYPIVPKIPSIGPSLAELLDIPETYALSAPERRRIELEEWEESISASSKSLDQRERDLEALSNDLSAMAASLDAEREEIASRLEALSRDEDSRDAPALQRVGGSSIEETIRTFQDMSPRNAAAILEKLDAKLAVSILGGLPQDTRGTLLARMDADIAARLTEQLTEFQGRRPR